jgi:ribosome-associated heat shock protein Hsp15
VTRDGKEIRIDKYLWAVRVFKTRSQATEACRRGKVIIDGIQVKPSRIVKEDDVIRVKRTPVVYSYRVKKLLGKRLSAKGIVDYVDNITPEEELKKLEVKETFFIRRDKGTGRPTKKERRIIEKLRRSDE